MHEIVLTSNPCVLPPPSLVPEEQMLVGEEHAPRKVARAECTTMCTVGETTW